MDDILAALRAKLEQESQMLAPDDEPSPVFDPELAAPDDDFETR